MTTSTKAFRDMSPGTTVAYTGKFLRSTGLQTGSAGLDRFIVQECHCRRCESKLKVAVNQFALFTDPKSPGYDEEYSKALKDEVGNTWQHISTENLYIVGQLDSRNT
jgi:ATP-dependent phosphoenolpyruvate carboxykinase